MSTVETIHLHQTVAFLACGHSSMGYEQVVGDEVVCPVCVEMAERVKHGQQFILIEAKNRLRGVTVIFADQQAIDREIDQLIEATK